MAYATQQSMIVRFGESELIQVTDDESPQLGTINVAVLEKALNDASGMIDGYLAARYQVPVSPVPDLIELFTCDIARYFLHTKEKPEAVEAGYKAARDMLRDIAAGKMQLDPAQPAAESPAIVGDVSAVGDPLVFTPTQLADY